ncbi:MAG: alpha/beta fold hydrolase [Paracoccus sp. (in: a-proteobacteria)]|nr:alpha/beta fold hydrolase [Paracoccus sp. (in: a-proteobacteria)]
MALCVINAGQEIPPDLFERIAALPACAPVIAMIHGYRFCPATPTHDPHRHILSLEPQSSSRRAMSWPAALGLTAEGAEGMGIAFGWNARGSLGAAYHQAGEAGRELGRIIDRIAEVTGRPVHLFGHSLGARVALAAARHSAGTGRVILLAAAELRDEAKAALTEARRGAEFINITTRENDLFDLGLELIIGRAVRPALGFGLGEDRPDWLDIQIDDARVLAGLETLGFAIAPGARRACHWSPYLREGVFDLYRAALTHPQRLPLPLIRQHLPQAPAPRWSSLLRRPTLPGAGMISGRVRA